MYKKQQPKESAVERYRFPHCDPRILHAPTECEFCDHNPLAQRLRLAWGIAFTGYTPEDKELPCPADYARGDTHKQWFGNVAQPVRASMDGSD